MLRVGLCYCLLLVPLLVHAQCPGMTTQQTPFAREQLTIGAVAQPLTASVYKPSGVTPSMAVLSVRGGDIFYEVVGTPTSTSGHPASGTFVICGFDSIAAFRAIRTVTDALLTITYYKPK